MDLADTSLVLPILDPGLRRDNSIVPSGVIVIPL
jgi:hypothetical protein